MSSTSLQRPIEITDYKVKQAVRSGSWQAYHLILLKLLSKVVLWMNLGVEANLLSLSHFSEVAMVQDKISAALTSWQFAET